MSEVNPARTLLDQNAIFQRAFNQDLDRIRVEAEISATIGDTVINVDFSAADGDSVLISDGVKDATITTVDGRNGLDVNLLGDISSSPSGLSTGLRASRMIITDTAQAVPLSPLANRNGISIRVLGANTVYFGNQTVTADDGYPKFRYEEIIADVKNNAAVQIYAVCASGQTCEVAIFEVA